MRRSMPTPDRPGDASPPIAHRPGLSRMRVSRFPVVVIVLPAASGRRVSRQV
jgi:hypothetical protein